MLSVRSIVRRWVGESRAVEPVTAHDLLARTGGDEGGEAGPVGDDIDRFDDVRVPARMVADLHDPRLIITLDYVGPMRGMFERRGRNDASRTPGCRRAGSSSTAARRHRVGTPPPMPMRPVIVAVVLTAATVAPLTLALAQWIAH